MEKLYENLERTLASLLEGDDDHISCMANAAACIWELVPEINWAGFYRLRDGVLVLGPFQGRPACIRIPLGKGVCGTAAAENRSQLVPDVHLFPGHIACDSASRAEIVVPLRDKSGSVCGVLDIDSPRLCRFGGGDLEGFEAAARVIEKALF